MATVTTSPISPRVDSSSPLAEEKKIRELTNQGGDALKSGQMKEALSHFQTALSVSESIPDNPRLKLSCLLNTGAALVTTGEHQRGISLLQSALSLLDSIPNRQTDPHTLENGISSNGGDLTSNTSPDLTRGDIYYNLGLANDSLGEFSLASTQLKQSVDYYVKAGAFASAGDVFVVISSREKERRNFKEQITCLLSAQRLYQDSGEQSKEIMTLTDLAIAYQTGGKREECIQSLTRAKIMGLRLDDPKAQSQLYTRLGLVYSSLKLFSDAIQSFERALPLLRLAIKDREGQLEEEAPLLQNIGAVYNEMGQYVEGIMYHKTAASLYNQLGQPVNEAKCLCNLALCQTQLQEYPLAHQSFTTALSLAQSETNNPLAFQALEGLGSLSYQTKNYEEARRCFNEALELLDSMRGEDTGLARERVMEKLSHVTETLQKGPEDLEEADANFKNRERQQSHSRHDSQLMPIPLTPRNTVRFSEDRVFSQSHQNSTTPHKTTPPYVYLTTPGFTPSQRPRSINETNRSLHSSTLTSLTATSDSSLLSNSVFEEPNHTQFGSTHPQGVLPTSPVVTQGSLALGPNTKALYRVEKQEVVEKKKKKGRTKSHQTTRIVPIDPSTSTPIPDRTHSAPPNSTHSSVCRLL
ncbi:PREDICTED: tetratricopeptide repeat protein 28-like [Amphimedon queenslandica]|uniref:MalT-like TPR region domain-containing protein n=1 Tax=Amphimedon queenslandica TaxID=400682 RepID=A0A1X7U193_AMPQE|nr:PREDICTED: tetratricopeptide repeat protein 28-like [Amphimedon queenslandica]|eukprot:XP_019856666.1 PREDICTED: tetratricopeptide repeat protein 28-like [Amphimedon queenslandica]